MKQATFIERGIIKDDVPVVSGTELQLRHTSSILGLSFRRVVRYATELLQAHSSYLYLISPASHAVKAHEPEYSDCITEVGRGWANLADLAGGGTEKIL